MPPSTRIKKTFWSFITPLFPYVRDFLTKIGIVRHHGRQSYHLGWLAPGRTMKDFVEYLKTKGFGNHFIAWTDDGQVLSLRRQQDFEWQYHLRIFEDREVRGHYEETPEDHPVDHFEERGMEARRDEFLELLGDWVVEKDKSGKIISQSAPAAFRGRPRNG